jgi:hypothetical protein
LTEAVASACIDPYFRAYAEQAIARRRNAQGLEIQLEFKHGRINPRKSFVQAI